MRPAIDLKSPKEKEKGAEKRESVTIGKGPEKQGGMIRLPRRKDKLLRQKT